MKEEKDLEQLLEFLEKCVEEDVIRNPYEVCIDCREVATLGQMRGDHEGHTIVFQDIDHSGVREWIRCLRSRTPLL